MADRYLEPHQARKRPNTPFEDLLATELERAYAQDKHEIGSIVTHLNQFGPPCPLTPGEWDEDAFKTLMARLGE